MFFNSKNKQRNRKRSGSERVSNLLVINSLTFINYLTRAVSWNHIPIKLTVTAGVVNENTANCSFKCYLLNVAKCFKTFT